MNFYASRDYLEVVAAVYFPGRRAVIGDYEVDGQVFRLLRTGRSQPVTSWFFLDYHQALEPGEVAQARPGRVYLKNVVRKTVTIDEWQKAEASNTRPSAFYVDFTAFPTYAAYRDYVKTRARDRIKKNTRLRERLADDVGELEFLVDDARADVIELSLRWKAQQLVDTGLPNIFENAKNTEFFHELRRRGILRASTLRAKGRLLAVWLGVVHERVWTGWIFTYDHDPTLKKYSLGWQLMESILEESYRSGHRAFDFSIGSADYKLTYGTHVMLLGPVGTVPLKTRLLERVKGDVKRVLAKYPRQLSMLKHIQRTVRNRLFAGR